MALAPSLALFGVPSSSISISSMPTWSVASMPNSSSAMVVVDVLDGLEHALAAVAVLVAVAQLQRLVRAGGCAGRHRRAPERAVFQHHFHFHGGVAARIQNLAGLDRFDVRHGYLLVVASLFKAIDFLSA